MLLWLVLQGDRELRVPQLLLGPLDFPWLPHDRLHLVHQLLNNSRLDMYLHRLSHKSQDMLEEERWLEFLEVRVVQGDQVVLPSPDLPFPLDAPLLPQVHYHHLVLLVLKGQGRLADPGAQGGQQDPYRQVLPNFQVVLDFQRVPVFLESQPDYLELPGIQEAPEDRVVRVFPLVHPAPVVH